MLGGEGCGWGEVEGEVGVFAWCGGVCGVAVWQVDVAVAVAWRYIFDCTSDIL